jgi:hypothetical protein
LTIRLSASAGTFLNFGRETISIMASPESETQGDLARRQVRDRQEAS